MMVFDSDDPASDNEEKKKKKKQPLASCSKSNIYLECSLTSCLVLIYYRSDDVLMNASTPMEISLITLPIRFFERST